MLEDKTKRRPILDPLLLALKSRRVLIALCTLGVGLLVMIVPTLEPVQRELLMLVVTLALALIGGYSVEDAARAARSQPLPSELAEQIQTVVADLIDRNGTPKADR